MTLQDAALEKQGAKIGQVAIKEAYKYIENYIPNKISHRFFFYPERILPLPAQNDPLFNHRSIFKNPYLTTA